MLDKAKFRTQPIAANARFGRLLVRRVLSSRQCECECDCGTTWMVAAHNLRSGATTSCGCFARELNSRLKRQHEGNPALRRIINSYVFNARARKLEWALSTEQAQRLFGDACYYCGDVGSMTRTTRRHELRYNGIDRLDSSRGYTPENSVSACKSCNRMKNTLSADAFIAHLRRVLKHWDAYETCGG